jgi:FMN phosphatase YigB (HAD superfamily)
MRASPSSRQWIALFDVDNTLYPRSTGLGRAMGDRIVHWVRENIDVKSIDESILPPAKEVGLCCFPSPCSLAIHILNKTDSSFNHPPDIDATDELIERLCLHYYLQYGLTIVGLVKHQRITKEQEDDCNIAFCVLFLSLFSNVCLSDLEVVHKPSTELERHMPHKHEHNDTVKLLSLLKEKSIPMYLFSNAPGKTTKAFPLIILFVYLFVEFHVWRVLEHIGVNDKSIFEGMLDYLQMREHCKPQMTSYTLMFEMVKQKFPDSQPSDCVFFDDAKVNLKSAKHFGFLTGLRRKRERFFFIFFIFLFFSFLVLICGEKEHEKHNESYIDFVIDDVRSVEKMIDIFK